MPPKLSVIMPCVNGGMDVIYTMQSILLELKTIQRVWENEVELVLINNWCPEVANQHMKTASCGRKMTRADVNVFMYGIEDKWGKKMASYASIHPEVKYFEYTKKLSHWQAKNTGIRSTQGELTDFLFFCDAHCIITPGTLRLMYKYYVQQHEHLHGTLHLPLTYMLDRPGRRLIYKHQSCCDPDKGMYHYSFTPYRQSPNNLPFTVGAMSTCGMMMSRYLYDLLGGWPAELGIYGGGENFINFTLAVLGKSVSIYPTRPLHHYAEKRGYNYEYVDYKRNQIIATYMFGGRERASKFSQHCKLDAKTADRIITDIINKCSDHRALIEKSQIMDIEDWYDKWQQK